MSIEGGETGLWSAGRFAAWAADELGLPGFLYGTGRTLPDIRRSAWSKLAPDTGPDEPHPTAGAICVGARDVLVAYNVWLEADIAVAKRIAKDVRTQNIRTLGLQVGAFTQVSMNLVSPHAAGPDVAFDAVVACAREHSATVLHAELVGLLPHDVLSAVPRGRWEELDLAEGRTIEARLETAGISR